MHSMRLIQSSSRQLMGSWDITQEESATEENLTSQITPEITHLLGLVRSIIKRVCVYRKPLSCIDGSSPRECRSGANEKGIEA